jgi:ribonuclease HI
MRIWIDGAGWNGKISKYAIVSRAGKTVRTVKEKKTNNEMEYHALLKALETCKKGDEILTDSQLVVGQTTKGWKIKKEHLRPLVEKAKKLIAKKNVRILWVPRSENSAGKLLEYHNRKLKR